MNHPSRKIAGVYAALLVPRLPDSRLDVPSFQNNLEFLLQHGIHQFALNGATGEFCLTTAKELGLLLEITRKTAGEGASRLCGIGSASLSRSLAFGRIAAGAGAAAVLLPMPFFFRYEQQDLAEFCRAVARELPIPVLLYNLPMFVSELKAATARNLFTECPNIAGIKDSGGSLGILRELTISGFQVARLVGNDSVLAAALQEGVCDGVVSGVACVFPELIAGMCDEKDRASAKFRRLAQLLDEFIAHINEFPTPWGLKLIGEARGISPARFAQPLSPQRAERGRCLQEWFRQWQPAVMHVLAAE